jgi:hypothetical protein
MGALLHMKSASTGSLSVFFVAVQFSLSHRRVAEILSSSVQAGLAPVENISQLVMELFS